MSADEKIKQILRQGLEKFGLDVGIVSRIEGNNYTVNFCESTGQGIAVGTEFELLDTYCSDVIRTGKTRYYKDVAEISEMLKHPCYLNTQLRSYVGTPVLIDGEIWGTLNYSSIYPHKLEYTAEEIQFLEDQAATVSQFLVAR
ncbi:GAF domain-containing protein [Kaarinaea lacus]